MFELQINAQSDGNSEWIEIGYIDTKKNGLNDWKYVIEQNQKAEGRVVGVCGWYVDYYLY